MMIMMMMMVMVVMVIQFGVEDETMEDDPNSDRPIQHLNNE